LGTVETLPATSLQATFYYIGEVESKSVTQSISIFKV